jgi:hypothetical protein
MPVVNAIEGDYELVAPKFKQLKLDANNRIVSFVMFTKGERIHLSAEDADRLLRSGDVKCTTKEQATAAAANAGEPPNQAAVRKAAANARSVGGLPVARGETTDLGPALAQALTPAQVLADTGAK